MGEAGTAVRVLMIVHDYPPIGSAGTERVLRFAQYLPEMGYDPLILTTARYGTLPDDRAHVVARANDLLDGLFQPWRQRKVRGLAQEQQFRVATIANESRLGRVRDRVLIPDTKLGWLPGAVQLGKHLIAKYQPAILFSSSPPETAHLIAERLSRHNHLPWVADLRDGWTFEPPNSLTRQGHWRHSAEVWLEKRTLRQASAVVTATEPIAADLRVRYGWNTQRVRTVSNGYEPAEFAGLQRLRQHDGTFLIVYTGSLSGSYQARSADAFFRAVANLAAGRAALPLQVRIVGNTSDRDRAAVKALGLESIVSFVGPVSRREAHQHQLDADGLLLITVASGRSEATLKLFDYIGAGIPLLALVENNAASEIVRRYDLGVMAPPDNVEAITTALAKLIEQHVAGTAWPGFAEARRTFTRRRLTQELADVLGWVLNHGA